MDTAQAAVRTYHQQSVRLLSSPEQYYDVDDEVHRVRLRLPHLTTRDEEEKSEKAPAMAQVSTEVQIKNIIIITHNARPHINWTMEQTPAHVK